MTETDWELKDRRIAWENINSGCSQILSARITAGLFKPKDNKDAMKELLDSIGIVYASFLDLNGISGGAEKNKREPEASSQTQNSPFVIPPSGSPSPPTGWYCDICSMQITDKEKKYSEDKCEGQHLCRKHQKLYFDKRDTMREKIENATKPGDLK